MIVFAPPLQPLDPSGAATDALHQRGHVAVMVEGDDAHYILTVKRNKPS
ncbi:hypothetical protein [Microbispora sp. ATCC PTA-5024]|nr:hypothetical protein [Microbispora sp. ATCC PTA-5024]